MEFNQVRASHILVPTRAQALKVKWDIAYGNTTFEKEAAKKSTCPSGAKGGDLGYFGKGQMVPEFEKKAFELAARETQNPNDLISVPVETQFGYHLIKVTGKK